MLLPQVAQLRGLPDVALHKLARHPRRRLAGIPAVARPHYLQAGQESDPAPRTGS